MVADPAPLVSIGLPFYNPGPFIVDAVRSVFAQTYTNWELILVDDGSTDQSLEIVRRIRDPRVKVVSDGKNLGLVERLNQISRMAQGKYLARMDADDLMHPRRLELQVSFLETNPHVDVVDTGAYILNLDGEPVGVRGLESRLPTALEVLKWGGYLHASIMARRAWFLEHSYNPHYPRAEDRELWARVFGKTHFGHINQPLYFYRFAGNVRPKAYLMSYASERRVLLRHGPRLVGWLPSLWLYGRSLIKSFVLVGLSILGLHNLATRRSFNPLEEKMRQEAETILAYLKQQPVPGL